MKKNVIALLMAIVMASGSIGSVPAFAAETPAEETVEIEEEKAKEIEEVTEETDNASEGETVEDFECGGRRKHLRPWFLSIKSVGSKTQCGAYALAAYLHHVPQRVVEAGGLGGKIDDFVYHRPQI